MTETQIANVDAALTTQETELAGLIALSEGEKRRLRRMGNKTESFSRQALQVASQIPQMIPANIPVADAIADIKLLDQLRPRLTRMSRDRTWQRYRCCAWQRHHDGGLAGLWFVEARRSCRRHGKLAS